MFALGRGGGEGRFQMLCATTSDTWQGLKLGKLLARIKLALGLHKVLES